MFRISTSLVDPLDDTNLTRLVETLCNTHRSLARSLDVKPRFVDETEIKYQKDKDEVMRAVLREWRDRRKEMTDTIAMVQEMRNALTKLQLTNVADEIKHRTYVLEVACRQAKEKKCIVNEVR